VCRRLLGARLPASPSNPASPASATATVIAAVLHLTHKWPLMISNFMFLLSLLFTSRPLVCMPNFFIELSLRPFHLSSSAGDKDATKWWMANGWRTGWVEIGTGAAASAEGHPGLPGNYWHRLVGATQFPLMRGNAIMKIMRQSTLRRRLFPFFMISKGEL